MSAVVRVGLSVAAAAWVLIAAAAWWLWPVLSQLVDPGRIRTFYVPSESMMPTLHVNDRIRPRAALPIDLRLGTVVVFQGHDTARLGRIAAIAGETIMVRGGKVWVDGHAAALRDRSSGPALDGQPTRLELERLPGERRPHLVLDAGYSMGDDFGPLRVPPGDLFVLGYNRDRAADSRFPPESGGAGLVQPDRTVGVVDRLLWRAGFRDLDRSIDLSNVP